MDMNDNEEKRGYTENLCDVKGSWEGAGMKQGGNRKKKVRLGGLHTKGATKVR